MTPEDAQAAIENDPFFTNEVEPETTAMTAHTLQYLSLDGLYPAAICSCGKGGFTFTRIQGDTAESVKARLDEMHREHVEETLQPATP